MTPSKVFLYFCLSFIGGIFLNSFLEISQLLILVFLILGITLISVFWRYKTFAIFGFCLLFLVLGIWRYQRSELEIMNDELRKYNDLDQKVVLIGVVSAEPDIKEKSQRLIVKVEQLIEEQKKTGPLFISGKVLTTTNRYPEYKYGDKLTIYGKIKFPSEDIDGFNYRNYLQKDGVYSVMEWPEIKIIGENFGNPVIKTLLSFKNKFKETARQFISPPREGVLEALIFGDEENISEEWKDKFNITGTRHMAAVSGMNITIISVLILNFFLLLGFWRQRAFYFSIILLFFYILMIGAPASAVRAGIMGGLLLLSQYLGRMSEAARAVVFAATFMLYLNPLLLKLDVGFQLSFLAILGIIYLQPVFSHLFKKIPDPKFFPIKTTLSTTMAAQTFTLPILVYNFGYIPILSPITNILIAPFLSPITILILIFGLSGMIFLPLGYILSWPVWLALSYILGIIDWFSKAPFASLALQNLNPIWLITFYLILGLAVWRLKENEKLKFLKY